MRRDIISEHYKQIPLGIYHGRIKWRFFCQAIIKQNVLQKNNGDYMIYLISDIHENINFPGLTEYLKKHNLRVDYILAHKYEQTPERGTVSAKFKELTEFVHNVKTIGAYIVKMLG